MLDEKVRKKWDDHIANCKRYLDRLKPGEEPRYKYHYECEIAIDDYLRELETYRPGDGTTIHFHMGPDEPLRDQHGNLLDEKITAMVPESALKGIWVSVKDRLPEIGVEVLTYEKEFPGYNIGYLQHAEGPENHKQWWYVKDDESKGCLEVDFWQPLPEPPK